MNTLQPPASVFAGAWRIFDFWLLGYRRTWKGTVITSFVTPFLYILAMGILLGGFVTAGADELEGATSYLAFVAPGMVAVQAMTTVVGEVTYPVMGMAKWNKVYYSMIATPLRASEIVLAQLGFVMFRVLTSSAVFFLVLVPFGVFESILGALLALPVQLLLGLAFATPVFGLAAGVESESVFALISRLGMLPLTLFSGTFFPLANLGPVLETIGMATPLWHGVDLSRMLVLGRIDWPWAAMHVAYLLTCVMLGWFWVLRRLERRLVQ
jgi:lipooligosaccharide transport system permease protein